MSSPTVPSTSSSNSKLTPSGYNLIHSETSTSGGSVTTPNSGNPPNPFTGGSEDGSITAGISTTNVNAVTTNTSASIIANPAVQAAVNANAIAFGEKAKRRKHKNSKLGCPNCKKRRVKCSEDLPACMNCRKHKVKCGYLDYTEEQLEALREMKAQNESDDDIVIPTSTNTTIAVAVPKLTKIKAKPRSNSMMSRTPFSNTSLNTTTTTSTTVQTEEEFEETFDINSEQSYPAVSYQTITQDFDNLLSDETVDELPIIYPVYSFNDLSQNHSHPHNNSNNSNSNSNNSNNSNNNNNNNKNFHNFGRDRSQSHPLSYKPKSKLRINAASVSHAPLVTGKAGDPLPGAIHLQQTFTHIQRQEVDYWNLLVKMVTAAGPVIQKGTASLQDIRMIYRTWLNSFIYKGFNSQLMFNVLINLTTNFLISNSFQELSRYLTKLNTYESVARAEKLSNERSICIVKSFKYYAKVIKDLRILLNTNEDPDLVGSVSYILSLMSIYDPEATLNSMCCFRDGLFSILTYNYNSMIKIGIIPTLIPVHLKLMTNIVRSVYLPSYDPTFLTEFQQMLSRFGDIVMPLLRHDDDDDDDEDEDEEDSPTRTLHMFIQTKFNDLVEFTKDTIATYIPMINGHLRNVDLQQEILYDMLYRWVRMFPAKLITVRRNSDPLEAVLYLFYKVFKKALYAMFPQVKFFFLRDFDSPLMLDVFSGDHDQDIFLHMLSNPNVNSLPIELYEPIIEELKVMSSYLIRMITFFQMRLNLLYRFMVYEEVPKERFKIDNVKQWRNTIQDIAFTRYEFNQVIGLEEVQIKSFMGQLIRRENYPRLGASSVSSVNSSDYIDVDVDFMTLQESGLLANDYNIMTSV
ncbi:uncharacterized protein SPAPADRAFT_133833 [Spathaspora passalidarum NRRL Y-27907]|uniref:Zn(2)-C6 fungal-type domain-containing protein n=1 Tax=Spathaspora passalidarum (strain NRRL Y-27907 / 11-Y1) TaxID=619300 RepID=G3AJX8_SPAPN|nr:uncharacterized protein SPAPADRAFT_133833 [Spathaspora passalidarum NRRL Y-27907]EGW34029.1 hypothetical protein SPAPADRAFT_133833 [Spathaspora passalidarum NRRL Y-27907]